MKSIFDLSDITFPTSLIVLPYELETTSSGELQTPAKNIPLCCKVGLIIADIMHYLHYVTDIKQKWDGNINLKSSGTLSDIMWSTNICVNVSTREFHTEKGTSAGQPLGGAAPQTTRTVKKSPRYYYLDSTGARRRQYWQSYERVPSGLGSWPVVVYPTTGSTLETAS